VVLPSLPGYGFSGEPGDWGTSVTASGGHFAAFEQPDLFVNEISSFFRLIR